MLSVSLDYPFLITSLVFSNVYLELSLTLFIDSFKRGSFDELILYKVQKQTILAEILVPALHAILLLWQHLTENI